MNKMRFYLKISERTYGIEPGRTVQSIQRDFLLTSRLIAPIFFIFYSCFSGIGTNRRFFTNLGEPGHLEYLETLYNLGEF